MNREEPQDSTQQVHNARKDIIPASEDRQMTLYFSHFQLNG